jgi:hypothetical protein
MHTHIYIYIYIHIYIYIYIERETGICIYINIYILYIYIGTNDAEGVIATFAEMPGILAIEIIGDANFPSVSKITKSDDFRTKEADRICKYRELKHQDFDNDELDENIENAPKRRRSLRSIKPMNYSEIDH